MRWIVIALATVAACWGVYYMLPSIGAHAFFIGGHSVSWIMLVGGVFAYSFHRFTSKR
jgi:hypothetical protein